MGKYKWFEDPQEFDVEAAETLVWEALRAKELTVVTSRWGELVSTEAVGEQLADIFRRDFQASTEAQLKAHGGRLGAVDDEVAQALFGDLPLLVNASTPEEEAARDRLVKVIWGHCSPNPTSALSLALSERDSLMVLEKKISKTRGSRVPTAVKVRFVTSNWEMIRELSVIPGIERYEAATKSLEARLAEVGKRIPTLRLPIAVAVEPMMPAIRAILQSADVATVKASIAAIDQAASAMEALDEGDQG